MTSEAKMRFKPISTSKCCVLMLRCCVTYFQRGERPFSVQNTKQKKIGQYYLWRFYSCHIDLALYKKLLGAVDMRALHIASKYCWGLGF